ncbi:MAG TPA: helix-turn-helix domain-containing protein [Solirubrobacterales bacterium]|nr:helix-turn-helix domain-containing protein [Solirubrobacterales bacterium]
MAEACADRGFAEVTVTDIVKRAGVSNVTFYKQFASKRDCLLGAHEELLERLLEEMDRACAAESEREAKVRAGVRVALELLAADTPTARLLTVEVLAGGPAGMERQATAIEALAVRLQDEGGSGAGLPNAAWARVGAMTLLVGRLVMAGEASGLPELEDELVAMALDSSASDE